MGKHYKQRKHPAKDDLHDQIIGEEVKHIFKEHPNYYISKLEELGFAYHDDEFDPEEIEEATAHPKNANQEYLISFLEGDIPLSTHIITVFLEERRSSTPNYPLFRRYFKEGNKHLLSLLLHGLQLYPVLDELLCDLAFYHEFQPVLEEVVRCYLIACEKQENLEIFGEYVLDFHYATVSSGFDAFNELRNRHPHGTPKRAVIDFLSEMDIKTLNFLQEKDL